MILIFLIIIIYLLLILKQLRKNDYKKQLKAMHEFNQWLNDKENEL